MSSAVADSGVVAELPARGASWVVAEATWKRRVYVGLACLVALGFFLTTQAFFMAGPGQQGIDENAYLVAGKNLAYHLTPGMKPASVYGYIGMMWVRTAGGWYYPKYPTGVPLLNAVAIWLSGGHDKFGAFYVSPLCATAAVLAMFFMARELAGSFLGLLGAILLATNPTMLELANVPSSHAPAVGFALWGMTCLAWWWGRPRMWLGLLAGLLLGFTAVIRSSEGLLVLPLVVAAVTMIRVRKGRTWLAAAGPVLAWGLPVVVALGLNWLAMGHFTGYEATHESTGFTLAEFMRKWDFTVQQNYVFGLFMIFPVGLLGMAMIFRRSWRMGLLLTLWVVPSGLLYTAYYWGTQAPGVGFLRFFLTLYPPLIGGALWLLEAANRGAAAGVRRGSVALPVVAGLLTSGAAALGLHIAVPEMSRQQVHNANLVFSARQIMGAIPALDGRSGRVPMVFADAGMFPQLLQYLQFVGDGEWYAGDAFEVGMGGNLDFMESMGKRGPGATERPQDAPVLLDPGRIGFLKELYGKATAADLRREQSKQMNAALDAGRGVYLVLGTGARGKARRVALTAGYEFKELARWEEPVEFEEGPRETGRRSWLVGRDPTPLVPPRFGAGFFDRGPSKLCVVEVTRRVAGSGAAE